METFWHTLSTPWQTCLEMAWQAYCAGGLAIGAAIVDENGRIISRGRNRRFDPRNNDGYISSSKLAHAELNALITLPEDDSARHGWSLYTTTEPCPLCMGAFYMAGLRSLYYGAYDPWAGSVNLLGATPYLSRKPIQVTHPNNQDLEAVIVAVSAVSYLEGRIERADDVLTQQKTAVIVDHKFSNLSRATHFGEILFESSVLNELQSMYSPVEQVFNTLASRWRDFK